MKLGRFNWEIEKSNKGGFVTYLDWEGSKLYVYSHYMDGWATSATEEPEQFETMELAYDAAHSITMDHDPDFKRRNNEANQEIQT